MIIPLYVEVESEGGLSRVEAVLRRAGVCFIEGKPEPFASMEELEVALATPRMAMED